MELTEVTFWDEYWDGVKIPNTVNLNHSFERSLAKELKKYYSGVGGDVFEIGCAPGKWLAFMEKEFGLKPNGLEYSKAGVDATLRNFRWLGIHAGVFISGDFLKIKPERHFDVVVSFGFIEHFSDVDKVVDLHLQWLKPGGTLIIGVPNFCGIYYGIQKVLDRTVLDKHNLKIMNLDYFERLANRFDLKPTFINYIGSFEPGLPLRKSGKVTALQFGVRSLLWISRHIRKIKLLDSLNHRFFSSYILAVYEKGSDSSKI